MASSWNNLLTFQNNVQTLKQPTMNLNFNNINPMITPPLNNYRSKSSNILPSFNFVSNSNVNPSFNPMPLPSNSLNSNNLLMPSSYPLPPTIPIINNNIPQMQNYNMQVVDVDTSHVKKLLNRAQNKNNIK